MRLHVVLLTLAALYTTPKGVYGGILHTSPSLTITTAQTSTGDLPGVYTDDGPFTITCSLTVQDDTSGTGSDDVEFVVDHVRTQFLSVSSSNYGSTSASDGRTQPVATVGIGRTTVVWGALSTSSSSTIQVTFSAAVLTRGENSINTVSFKLYIRGSLETTISREYRVLGPDMLFILNPSIDLIEAYDIVQFEGTIAIGDDASEDAQSVEITITFDDNTQTTYQSGSGVYGSHLSTTTTTISDNALASGVDVGDVTSLDSKYVRFSRVVTENVQTGSHVGCDVTISYQCACRSARFTHTSTHYLEVRGLDLSAASGDVVFGSDVGVGDTSSVTKRIRIPPGTLADFAFYADFISSELSDIPFTWFSSRLTLPSTVSTSRPSLLSVSRNGIDVTSSRRRRSLTSQARADPQDDAWESGEVVHHYREKRQAGATHGIRREMGTLTNNGPGDADVYFEINYEVGDVPRGGRFDLDNGLAFNRRVQALPGTNMMLNKPILKATKVVEVVDDTELPNKVRFSITIEHDTDSAGTAYQIEVRGGSDAFEVYWDDLVGASMNDMGIRNDRVFTWYAGSLAAGASLFMSYNATPRDDGRKLEDGESYHNVTVEYKASSLTTNTYANTATGPCCVEKIEDDEESTVRSHGFTVLAFVIGLILGIIIVLVILLILIKVCKKRPFSRNRSGKVSPTSSYYGRNMKSQGGGLILAPAAMKAGRGGYNPIRDQSNDNPGDTFVGVLTMKDRMQMRRRIENLDLLATIDIDTQIELEREAAMTDASISLIYGLCKNSDITPKVRDAAVNTYKQKVEQMKKDNERDFQTQLAASYAEISSKNQAKLNALLEKQKEERETTEENTEGLTQEEKKEVMDLLKKQQEAEQNDLTHHLKLEQDEQGEKLRKEFAVRKRMGVKDLQQQMLDEVKTKGQLSEEKAEWMMKEHFANQAAAGQLYDDEVSRQRMLLEEKLARRRALAARADLQEDGTEEMIGKVTEHQEKAIKKMKKDNLLDEDQARELLEQSKRDIENTKSRYEAEKYRQEQSLQERLNKRKKQRLQEKAKEHKQQISELEKAHKNNSDEYDPIGKLEQRQLLLSKQREEVSQIENNIDEEHAEELEALRTDMAVKVQQDLQNNKQQLMNKLQGHGMSDDEMNKMMEKHNSDVERLKDIQTEERDRQKQLLQERLERRRQQWEDQREEERAEQAEMREREDNVVRKLMDNQVAMSQDEREKILKEHEKQMVQVENSLTLSKLQQRRMLEEKMARRKAARMDKLQRKQNQEQKKQDKSAEHDNEDLAHEKQIEMMKKHAEEKMALMRDDDKETDEEMERITADMKQERENALKEQEARLAAMMAQLQMDKAKELARIEEQQKAINDLKSNLMEDLTEKGVLGNPECKQVLERHQQDQDNLNKKLDDQRARQEQALKERLEKRLRKQEESLEKMQEQQRQESVKGKTALAAKIRQAALLTKQQAEVEQFRKRMDKEIEQTLQDMRRKNDLKRLQAKQDQELNFAAGLVRLGKFDKDELNNVVQMLFPTKTEQERQDILKTIGDGAPSPAPRDGLKRKKSLQQRVKTATLARHVDIAGE